MALEKRYYADEGLEVTIDSGAGSRESIPRVASGTYDMGFGDINSLIRFRDENPGLDVKAVMMAYDIPPFAIIGRKSLGVSTWRDLEGKTLGAPPPDAAFAQWASFAAVNEIDTDKIAIESVGFPVREPMLAQGKVQAIFGYSFSSFINLKAAGVPEDDISVILMSKNGLDLYGNVIMVNPDFAAANSEAVAGFVRATIKGYQEAVANPAEAIAYVLARNDVAREAVEIERWQMAIADSILTDWVKENGFGNVDMARLERAIEQLAISAPFKTDIAADDIFDPRYLPPVEDRRM